LSRVQKDDNVVVESVFEPAVVLGRLEKWLPNLTPQVRKKLVAYQGELLRFNKTINLISPTSVKNAEAIHFADSALACQIVRKHLVPDKPIYDFGSGNGLPGLVFAILYPDIPVILIDRDQRKLEFCKHIASISELKNVTIQLKGVEELAPGSVVNAMARGFAPLPKALMIARKTVAKGGKFYHLKGDGWANELAQVPSQLFSFWMPSLIGQYKIPDTSVDMFVALTDKLAD
jgi:16S rRNA (guanine527-N7)-methyltransferase